MNLLRAIAVDCLTWLTKNVEKETVIIAFSGGKTSAYMTRMLLLLYSWRYNFIVVFANTGKERPETLQFIHDCDKYFKFGTVWVEAITNPKHGQGVKAKIVSFETCSRDGEPFEASIAKHGISNINAPMCTRELKTYTIDAYLRSMGLLNCNRAIGIRMDELDRRKTGKAAKNTIYPLVSWFPTYKGNVADFWYLQYFTLQLEDYEGNCDCCYKKSFAKLIRIARENPHLFEWWVKMETKYSLYVPASRPNQKTGVVNFYRKNLSARDILRLSLLTDEEILAELKEDNLEEMYNGCSESCESF